MATLEQAIRAYTDSERALLRARAGHDEYAKRLASGVRTLDLWGYAMPWTEDIKTAVLSAMAAPIPAAEEALRFARLAVIEAARAEAKPQSAAWRSVPVTVDTGAEPQRMTLGEFYDANADAMDEAEARQIAGCLATGQPYHGGGGAGAEWTVRLAGPEAV